MFNVYSLLSISPSLSFSNELGVFDHQTLRFKKKKFKMVVENMLFLSFFFSPFPNGGRSSKASFFFLAESLSRCMSVDFFLFAVSFIRLRNEITKRSLKRSCDLASTYHFFPGNNCKNRFFQSLFSTLT